MEQQALNQLMRDSANDAITTSQEEFNVQLYIVTKLHFQFSWPSALSLLVTMLILWYLFLSASVKALIKDWPLKE